MLYNIIFYILEFGVFVASFFSEKVKKMRRGERDAFRVLREQVDPTAKYAWFHAASLGEFEQGRPIIEQFRKDFPEYKVLLTFFSPSGYEVRKDYDKADIVCYLPIDTFTNARRFLRMVRPQVAFFIKYEFWYNYLHILHHRQVPVYSVSSIFRPDQIFFKWYGHKYRHVLHCFTQFFVQNEQSKELLATLGINNVIVTGDTRFDRVTQIARQAKDIPLAETFKGDSKVLIAGSSWQPDEEIIIPYFRQHKDWKLILAPHVIGESHMQQLSQLLKDYRVVRYTQVSPTETQRLQDAEVLIIDCYGLLSSIYRYGDIAYIGGGFGVGIHNLLEAAVWSLPVVFGPNHERFQEAHGLKACGGGFTFSDAPAFKRIMDKLVGDDEARQAAAQAAGEYVSNHAGATDKLLSMIKDTAHEA